MKYLIIGLGHYGATLAMELTAMGHEVVGADGNGLHVDSVKDRMAASFVLDATDEMALSVLPLKSVDAVIVAIGDNFGASVRIVSLLKKLEVKRIYARAVDEVHKGVLEAFSIDRILTPEQDAARLLAQQLELDGGAEFFQIDGNTYVFKLEIPEKLVGYHINELNLEQEFGLKLISLVQGKQVKNFLGISVFEKEVANTFLRIMHFRKATDWCATEPILVLCSSGNQSVSPFSNGCFSCSVPAGSDGHWPDAQQR